MVPQQFHVDVTVDDVDAAEQAVLALGATKTAEQPGVPRRQLARFTSTRWATLLPLLGLAPQVVSADAEMQVDPVALPLDLIDFALAVVSQPASKASSSASRGAFGERSACLARSCTQRSDVSALSEPSH